MLDMVVSIPGVIYTKFDFCMLGMLGEDDIGIAPAKKTTGIMTNGKVIAEVISQHRCDGTHRHVHVVHGKAKACEIDPEPFCRTLCHAYALQIEHDQKTNRNDDDRNVAAVLEVSEIMCPLVDKESSCSLEKSTVTDSGGPRRCRPILSGEVDPNFGVWTKCKCCRWMCYVDERDD